MRDLLRAEVAARSTSVAGIATILNKMFNLDLTRNSIIGQMNGLGLSKPRTVRYSASPPPRIKRKGNRVITTKPLPPPKPEPVIVDVGVAPRTDLISIFDLKPTSCRWPYGNEAPFQFCGATVCNGDQNNSYCLYHTCVASVKPTQRVNTRPFHRAA